MHLLIISGRSGSGKSTALHVLEDIGFTCIDNMPASLLPDLCERNSPFDDRNYAISMDARSTQSDLELLPNLMQHPAIQKHDCKVIFLDAEDDVLLKRFSETRRKHPLTDAATGLQQALQKEKSLLQPIANVASIAIDTSDMGFHDLRDLFKKNLGFDHKGMALSITSFGFKYGMPKNADLVFDVRCLPNPHWEPGLRELSGCDQGVVAFLEKQDSVHEMYADIKQWLLKWLPRFEDDNRSYMTVAIGCTGGRHRSVYLAQRLTNDPDIQQCINNVQCHHRQLSANGAVPSKEK